MYSYATQQQAAPGACKSHKTGQQQQLSKVASAHKNRKIIQILELFHIAEKKHDIPSHEEQIEHEFFHMHACMSRLGAANLIQDPGSQSFDESTHAFSRYQLPAQTCGDKYMSMRATVRHTVKHTCTKAKHLQVDFVYLAPQKVWCTCTSRKLLASMPDICM
jgi:hypothetical protein